MASRKIGTIKIKLAEKLSKFFSQYCKREVIFYPEDLWTQEGFYRSRYHDLARWGGKDFTEKIHVSSWDTMTNFVKKSNEVYIVDEYMPGHYEVTY